MPSWLTGVVRLSILTRFRAYNELAARTLSEWDDLERRADRIADDERHRLAADPGYLLADGIALHPAGYAEDEFLETMQPLAQSMTNLFALGLYHLLEQQLIDFARIMHTRRDVPSNMTDVLTLLGESLQVDIAASYPMTPRLNELRLIANVVKHAEGRAAKELQELRPDLFEHPDVRRGLQPRPSRPLLVREPLSGQGLYLTRTEYQTYTTDVDQFWSRLTIDLDRTFA